MAYTHSKQEILLTATAVSATATGDKAAWVPGYVPHIIRGFSVIPTVSGTTLSGMVFNLNHISLTSGSTASTIGTINGTATGTSGTVMYWTPSSAVEITPGEEVRFNVGTAKTAVNVKAVIYVEPRWEQQANISTMIATT